MRFLRLLLLDLGTPLGFPSSMEAAEGDGQIVIRNKMKE